MGALNVSKDRQGARNSRLTHQLLDAEGPRTRITLCSFSNHCGARASPPVPIACSDQWKSRPFDLSVFLVQSIEGRTRTDAGYQPLGRPHSDSPVYGREPKQ